MSRTTKFALGSVIALSAFLASAAFPASAQTLGELADAQRMKQQTEMLKAKKELEAAEADNAKKAGIPTGPQLSPEAAKAAARLAEEAAKPKVVLHALYTRSGVWVAELTSNQQLAIALIGMRINGYQVTGISKQGLSIARPCSASDVRERIRCGKRVLNVGEAI